MERGFVPAKIAAIIARHKGLCTDEPLPHHLAEGVVQVAPRAQAQIDDALLSEIRRDRTAHHITAQPMFDRRRLRQVAGRVEMEAQRHRIGDVRSCERSLWIPAGAQLSRQAPIAVHMPRRIRDSFNGIGTLGSNLQQRAKQPNRQTVQPNV